MQREEAGSTRDAKRDSEICGGRGGIRTPDAKRDSEIRSGGGIHIEDKTAYLQDILNQEVKYVSSCTLSIRQNPAINSP